MHLDRSTRRKAVHVHVHVYVHVHMQVQVQVRAASCSHLAAHHLNGTHFVPDPQELLLALISLLLPRAN